MCWCLLSYQEFEGWLISVWPFCIVDRLVTYTLAGMLTLGSTKEVCDSQCHSMQPRAVTLTTCL